MKKLLIGLMLILATIFLVSCRGEIDYSKLRGKKGIFLASRELTFNGMKGKIIYWKYKMSPLIKSDKGPEDKSKAWFVYPSERFAVEPLHKVSLRYKLIQKERYRIPIVYIVEVTDEGLETPELAHDSLNKH